MKKLWRRFKKRLAGRVLGTGIYWAMRILRLTMRIRIIGGEVPQSYHDRGEGLIGVFWHGRLLLPIFTYTGKGFHVLISSHGDGDIIGNVMKRFGQRLVRGSSSKGGKEALREMVKLARGNHDLVITPDGPRGPAEVLKPGVANLSCLSGKGVIPMAWSCSRMKRFSSWDRFMLPYPFSRGVFIWGEPLFRLEGEQPEVFRQRIEQALKDVTAKADGYFPE
jgi:lysophospholipid acyltransferase (LPLAT)-like uncharacterized protein